MTSVIEKYKLLDQTIAVEIIKKWIEALEKISNDLIIYNDRLAHLNNVKDLVERFGVVYKKGVYKYCLKAKTIFFETFNFSTISLELNNSHNIKLIQDLIRINYEEAKIDTKNLEFSNNSPIKQYPANVVLNGDSYKFRGYNLKLTRNITVVSAQVQITLVGTVYLYLMDDTSKVVVSSQQNCNSNFPSWVSFEIPATQVKDNYSVMVSYNGTGSISYQDGNNSFRVISDFCQAESKHGTELINNEIKHSPNTYSIQLNIGYYEN